MKVAIIYNKDFSKVINQFGMQNKEVYNERTVKKVGNALEQNGHNVEYIDGNMEVIEALQGFMPKVLEGERMGMVFNMAYGIQGESRYTHIPSMLEMIGIPYIGSNPSGHALALDKVIAKIMMQKHDIPTPNFWVYSSHTEDMSDVEYPVIVKPKMEAVSYGIKVVYNEDDLKDAVKFIVEEFNQQALVEQFIRGREFAVGIIGNSPPEAFPVLEVDLDNDPDAIQSVSDKKKRPRQKICPADLPEELAKQMQEASIKAFQTLQLNDFSRVDIRLDQDGNFYILEINSMASLGMTGTYTFAAKAAGYEYDDLINKMLNVASYRYFGDEFLMYHETKIKGENLLSVKLKTFLRNRQIKYEKILSDMVNINTHVRNVEGINKLSLYLRKHLSSLGFSHQIIPQSIIGSLYFYSNHDNEYDILLLAHLDSSVQSSDRKYFIESGKKLFGTGIWSNKGGLAVMLAALDALNSRRELKNKRIGIFLVTDNALQNKVSASIIKKKALEAKYVLGLSGAFLNGGLVSSRSGSASYNAVLNLKNRQIDEVPMLTNQFLKLTTQFMKLNSSNVLIVPTKLNLNSIIIHAFGYGEASISLRFNNNDDFKALDNKINVIIPKASKSIDIQLSGGLKRPAMEMNDKIKELWEIFKKEAQKMDITFRQEHRWSSSDICFVDDSIMRVDGLGPVGGSDENNEEYILRHSLLERAALLSITITKLK